jgi:hypothetical protein
MQKLSENVDKRLDGHIDITKQVQEELARKAELKNREVNRDFCLMRKDIDICRQEVTEKDQVWKDKAGEKMSRLDDNIKAVCNENNSKTDVKRRNYQHERTNSRQGISTWTAIS